MINKENPNALSKHCENAINMLQGLVRSEGLDGRVKAELERVVEQIRCGVEEVRVQEQRAIEARLLAEQALNSRSDFLSRMNHETRTPINAILGMTRIALDAKDMDRVRECLEVIDSSSMQLMNIINDVLDMSSIELGNIQLEMEPFSFESMLVKLAGLIAVKTEQKKQKLYCNIDVNMPAQFKGDERRLSQVIMNLLNNAVKFTPEGGAVSVTAKQIAREGDIATIEVQVSDNGIGIGKQDQEKLFQAFFQSDGGAKRQFGGTGLGLAICKQLVEMMHGTIKVKSDVDRGSTFRFTVQLTVLDDGGLVKAKEKADVHGMNVLIVDPDEDTQSYFCQIMDSFKVRSQQAKTVEEAMHLVETARKAGEPFSILFMDWSLAEKDGVSVAQTLKRQYSVSTVAMLPMTQMTERMISAHEDTGLRYIAKPLFPSALLKSIYEISGSPIDASTPMSKLRYSFMGYHILLAEDVEINRRIFDQIMQGSQVAISHAKNGAVAVEMFQRNPELYDIILMDIHMPVMDGYEATRQIRNLPLPRAKTVPIVAVTANAFAADVERSLQAGMNAHLTKPIEVDRMLEVMHGLLKPADRMLTDAGDGDGSAQLEAERAVAEAEAKLRDNPYIDYDDALQKVRGSMRVLKILLQSFASNHQLEQLKAEVESRDYEVAARTAHAIKGACTNLSLGPLREKMDELEMQLKSHFHIDETMAEMETLFEATLGGVRDALETMRQIAKD